LIEEIPVGGTGSDFRRQAATSFFGEG